MNVAFEKARKIKAKVETKKKNLDIINLDLPLIKEPKKVK